MSPRDRFRIDAGFQYSVMSFSEDQKQVLTSRTLNTRLLKNGSIVLNWHKLLGNK